VLLACGLRRHEVAGLTTNHLQQREGHWAIVDLRGKAGHFRTIPVPDWVQNLLDEWTKAAGIATGSLFRRVSSAGKVWGEKVTEKLVWHVVKEFAAKIGVRKLAPHDLRRSCARLCRAAGGELEQIQFLLGHASVRPQNVTSAAPNGSRLRSMIASESSRKSERHLRKSGRRSAESNAPRVLQPTVSRQLFGILQSSVASKVPVDFKKEACHHSCWKPKG
jgi:integrase